MLDDYDDKFKDIDFNCSLVRSLKWSFFSVGVNKPAERKIIHHLLSCPKCRKVYEQYAQEVGYGKFDAIQYSMKFLKDENKTIVLAEDKITWVDNALNKKLVKLARSKAMREIMMQEQDTGFMEFLVLKLAKELDYLEECYKKEMEVKKNEKP